MEKNKLYMYICYFDKYIINTTELCPTSFLTILILIYFYLLSMLYIYHVFIRYVLKNTELLIIWGWENISYLKP